MLTYDLLADFPAHQPQVTEWLWQAFGSAESRPFFAALVQNSLRRDGLPITFIARDGERLAGTVGLWRSDLLSRQDLTPWLAALYVDADYRGQGLGEQLQQHAITAARQVGFHDLYLYASFRGYYERHGWQPIGGGMEYPAEPVTIYHRALGED